MNRPAPLAVELQAVAAGLPDATNHCFLKSNYYDLVNDDDAQWKLVINITK